MAVSVIAGLGNPGSEYRATRHNIGFEVVDALAASEAALWKEEKRFDGEVAKVMLGGRAITLLKPHTFMNDSGRSLGAFLRFLKLPTTDLCVVYDDITLEPGRLKLSLDGGAGGHNGITSVLQHIGQGFIRYRIGIGPKAHPQMKLSDWVLGKQTTEEKAIFSARMPVYLEGLHYLASEGIERAMNQFNTRT